MKRYIFALTVMFHWKTVHANKDSVEACYALVEKPLVLCIADIKEGTALPHAVAIELKTKAGAVILGGFPYLYIEDSISPDSHRRVIYISAAAAPFWNDLPGSAGLLSRKFSPIEMEFSNKWQGQVRIGETSYQFKKVRSR